jgi:threonine aldolase
MRIDLRSDTVTKPTPAMRRAMADAEVGDDVLDGDPTTQRLERRIAELLGKDAALFFPSGTMANQAALWLLSRPGTEVLLDAGAHILHYDGGRSGTGGGADPSRDGRAGDGCGGVDVGHAPRIASRAAPVPRMPGEYA